MRYDVPFRRYLFLEGDRYFYPLRNDHHGRSPSEDNGVDYRTYVATESVGSELADVGLSTILGCLLRQGQPKQKSDDILLHLGRTRITDPKSGSPRLTTKRGWRVRGGSPYEGLVRASSPFILQLVLTVGCAARTPPCPPACRALCYVLVRTGPGQEHLHLHGSTGLDIQRDFEGEKTFKAAGSGKEGVGE